MQQTNRNTADKKATDAQGNLADRRMWRLINAEDTHRVTGKCRKYTTTGKCRRKRSRRTRRLATAEAHGDWRKQRKLHGKCSTQKTSGDCREAEKAGECREMTEDE